MRESFYLSTSDWPGRWLAPMTCLMQRLLPGPQCAGLPEGPFPTLRSPNPSATATQPRSGLDSNLGRDRPHSADAPLEQPADVCRLADVLGDVADHAHQSYPKGDAR